METKIEYQHESGPKRLSKLITELATVRRMIRDYKAHESVLAGEAKLLMDQTDMEKGTTKDGVTFYLGKERIIASVPWQSLEEAERQRILKWARGHGMRDSVNATTFSAFCADRLERGDMILPEINVTTSRRLNVVTPNKGEK